jgi:hypothetical protein
MKSKIIPKNLYEKYLKSDLTSDPIANIVIDVDNPATNDLTEDVNYNPNSKGFEYVP